MVFNGSCPSNNGISLNNVLVNGPNYQPKLSTTLQRFRKFKIALSADVTKMYRQISMASEYRRYQRILWRNNEREKLQQFQLTTVTFGLTSSSSQAIRTLIQISKDEDINPTVKNEINQGFYVDDYLGGAQSIEEAKHLKKALTSTLLKGQFPLCKWRSNLPELTDNEVLNDKVKKYSTQESIEKVLGLQWNANTDEFSFKIRKLPLQPITKRLLISEISRIFDPLGFLSPCIISAKILFQKLWVLQIEWDEVIPKELENEYLNFRSEMSSLEQIRIPRYIEIVSSVTEIHGFCDASKQAYAAVIYGRTVLNGNIKIYLIAAKTKVSPLKPLSIARLELLAAYLLCKLLKEVTPLFPDCKVYNWTDSTTVLAWLSDNPARWDVFVGNRTASILEDFPRNHWLYVRSKNNPADIPSRGLGPIALVKLKSWWHGPEWLYDETWRQEALHIPNCNNEVVEHARRKETSHYNTTIKLENWMDNLLNRISKWSKLVRIVAFVLRAKEIFKNKARRNGKKLNPISIKHIPPISTAEFTNGRNKILNHVQALFFHSEIKKLKTNSSIEKESSILKLNPIIDQEGLLRVGGRIDKFEGCYDYIHPIILPNKHSVTTMIIRDIHERNFHTGITSTFNLSRQKYWILKGRRVVRELINKCVICYKGNPKVLNQIMGNLPKQRITPSRPFNHCGIDYAGPIFIKSRQGRGASKLKSYIAVFVCLATKAIHLETVGNLTTESFISALYKIMKGASLTFEELSTLLCEIEGILNSRPLCGNADEDSTYVVLTPSNFLIGASPGSLIDEDVSHLSVNRLSRWQIVKQMYQHFWKKYQHDYIHNLQQRNKWGALKENIKVGDVCLIKQENVLPNVWPLAVVLEVFAGKDGAVRVARLKTKNGEINRPIIKLCVLPSNDSNNS